MDSKLEYIAEIARKGKRQEAEKMATQVVLEKPDCGPAWVILAGIEPDLETRIQYLERAQMALENEDTEDNQKAGRNAGILLDKLRQELARKQQGRARA